MIKQLVLALAFTAGLAAPAYACQTHTYIVDGRMVVCTICPTVTTCV